MRAAFVDMIHYVLAERIDRIAIRDANDFRGELVQLIDRGNRRRGRDGRDRKLRGFRSREMENPCTEKRSGDETARRFVEIVAALLA